MSHSEKSHVSVVISGHVDAGKSSLTGRLLFDLGGISEREMDKLKAEAKALGKDSFAFAFYMDRQAEERRRGVTIACTTKEFYTDNFHYTIIDAPGHRDFIKNMITGSSQADVAVLLVPADGNFTTSIQKENRKEGVVQGQTRQHARLLNLLGVKQLIVCVNKMDCKTAKYSKARFDEVRKEMENMLVRVGWSKKFVKSSVPIIPTSGWLGDNLLTKSDKMKWWKGVDVAVGKEKVHVETLLDALNNMVRLPERKKDAPLRMPVSGVFKIKGVGDVITGRVEQGELRPGQEIKFLPTHTESNSCTGKVFTVEMHHKNVECAYTGDNVGINVKGLLKTNMPKVGDIITLKSDTTLKQSRKITAMVQVLDHPGELKPGYTPIGFIRTAKTPLRLSKINWKMGKSTGGQKVHDPPFLKANEMAEVVFEPQSPFVADAFDQCEGLARLAIMEGNGVVMLGKIMGVE